MTINHKISESLYIGGAYGTSRSYRTRWLRRLDLSTTFLLYSQSELTKTHLFSDDRDRLVNLIALSTSRKVWISYLVGKSHSKMVHLQLSKVLQHYTAPHVRTSLYPVFTVVHIFGSFVSFQEMTPSELISNSLEFQPMPLEYDSVDHSRPVSQ